MAALSMAYQVPLYCWLAFEVCLLIRDLVRGTFRFGRDRGTRLIVSVSLGGAIVTGEFMHVWAPAFGTPAAGVFAVAGLVVIWLGLAVRVWAVLALGSSFSTYIQVRGDQTIVTRGPYRWVRHPSYTGLLLIGFGFGVGAANWLSLMICAVVPLLGLLPRMRVEEAELVRVLGQQYRDYQNNTHRLIPGVW